MSANDKQVAGDHYKNTKVQHWDLVHDFWLDYYLGCSTKYLSRWWLKGTPVADVEKAKHFFEKWIELNKVHVTGYPNKADGLERLTWWLTCLDDSMQRKFVRREPRMLTTLLLYTIFTSNPEKELGLLFELLRDEASDWWVHVGSSQFE
jgi:hypothetical protein